MNVIYSFKCTLLSFQNIILKIQHSPKIRKASLVLLIFLSLISVPNIAFAAGFEALGTYLEGLLSSTFLRSLAIIAVIAAGILALTGRIQWGRFFVVFFGIFIIFGAGQIVTEMSTAASAAP